MKQSSRVFEPTSFHFDPVEIALTWFYPFQRASFNLIENFPPVSLRRL